VKYNLIFSGEGGRKLTYRSDRLANFHPW